MADCQSTWTSGRTNLSEPLNTDNWEWVINSQVHKPFNYSFWAGNEPSGAVSDNGKEYDTLVLRMVGETVLWSDYLSRIGRSKNNAAKCYICECEVEQL